MLKEKTILVVDDYSPIVERLTALLRELDGVSAVLAAYSYAECVDILRRRRPDVVLLDIHLPDRSGIELLDFIKSHDPSIGVIMISNQNNPHYRALCLDKGADYFVDKSNDFELLPSLIGSFRGCSETATGFLEL